VEEFFAVFQPWIEERIPRRIASGGDRRRRWSIEATAGGDLGEPVRAHRLHSTPARMVGGTILRIAAPG
jgi:hypothetical protein